MKEKRATKQEEKKVTAPSTATEQVEYELKPLGGVKNTDDAVSASQAAKIENSNKYQKVLNTTLRKLKIDEEQIQKAVKAIKDYHKKHQHLNKDLLADENEPILATITMSQVPEKSSPKPLQIKLPSPIYTSEDAHRVCMIVKDPQREIKDLIEDIDVPCLAKIIGYQKLMKNYK